jgi:phenylalanyl-tRNA synthetase beta chain
MPVLRFRAARVLESLGVDSVEEAVKLLERLKGEANVLSEELIEVEFELDRPDLYTLEGIRRAVRGLLGYELGPPRYELVDSGLTIYAEEVKTRPYVVGAVVWDVHVDEDFLEELIQFQEKLHQSHGGNRARVAIGLHDLDKLPSRTLYYRFEKVDEVRFTPLGYDREMDLRTIIEETEHGRRYGRISLEGDRHPVLYSGSDVISVPPIINAELTRIKPGTRSVFVDVTGTDLVSVLNVLYVLAANLAERSKSRRVGLVQVRAPWGSVKEPTMPYRDVFVSSRRLASYLGIELEPRSIVELLLRCRLGAELLDDGETVRVRVPAYRLDVINWVDLAEELLVALGIEHARPRRPVKLLRGRLLGYRYWERAVRKILLGLGFTEAYTYTLISCSLASLMLESVEPLRILNPVSEEMACYRTTVAASLLRVIAHSSYKTPVRVFEVGDVVVVENGVPQQYKRLGIAIADYKVGYEDIQAVVYSLLELLGDEIVGIEAAEVPGLISGRTARLKTRSGVAVVMGEVHPEVLEELGITHPVAVAEVDYTELARKARGTDPLSPAPNTYSH